MALLPAENENYANFIVQYSSNMHGSIGYISSDYFKIISEEYAVIYTPLDAVSPIHVNEGNYGSIPKYYTYMDEEALLASGITQVQNQPYLNLKGNGMVIAVIDSGIDYRHPAFRNAAGTSRITCIWDQSIPAGGPGANVPYGTEFTEQQINEALESENPYAVVPSRDENGHGTFLAGIAAGSADPAEGFSGAAPEATIIVVKLKPIKQYLREFYLLPEEADAYQEDDIMFAVHYAVQCARRMKKPLSICIGLGTSQGAHLGTGPLQQFLNWVSSYAQNAVSVAAGNEGNARHHFSGRIREGDRDLTAELRIGEQETGFVMEFWGDMPNFYSMNIIAPTGERAEIKTNLGGEVQNFRFVFLPTRIQATYIRVERQSGSTLIFLRFLDPAPGIWKFQIYGEIEFDIGFHMWLPVGRMITEETYFVESSPENTITNPGDTEGAMTMTAYNYRDGSLYLNASRGYLTNGRVKPDMAAPGVAIKGSVPGNADVGLYAVRSGTSISAAQTAGAAALLMEWAAVRGAIPSLNGKSIKNYLIRGASRDRNRDYPNQEWGYGALNLYRVFELLS